MIAGRDLGTAVLAALFALAAALRVYAAWRLGLHADEPVALALAELTAASGAPILPSGALQLQGAPLTYGLVPLLSAGLDPVGPLFWLRLPSVGLGLLAWAFAAGIARELRLARWPTWLLLTLLAVDPACVSASATVAPGALLQATTTAALWAYLRCARGDVVGAGVLALSMGLGLATDLTQAVLLLVLAGAAAAAFRADGARAGIMRLSALGFSAAPGVVLLLLDWANHTEIAGGTGLFGDRGIRFGASPNVLGWLELAGTGALGGLVTPLYAAAAGATLARERDLARVLPAFGYLTFVAVVVVVVGGLVPGPYLAVAPLGLIAAAVAVDGLVVAVRPRWMRLGLALSFAGLLLASGVLGVWEAARHPYRGPDYRPLFSWLSVNLQSGDGVLVARGPDALLGLEAEEARLLFGGGRVSRERATRTRNGQEIDRWTGHPLVHSTEALCGALLDGHTRWVLCDQPSEDDLAPNVRRLLEGSSRIAYEATGTRVREILPEEAWSPSAARACGSRRATLED